MAELSDSENADDTASDGSYEDSGERYVPPTLRPRKPPQTEAAGRAAGVAGAGVVAGAEGPAVVAAPAMVAAPDWALAGPASPHREVQLTAAGRALLSRRSARAAGNEAAEAAPDTDGSEELAGRGDGGSSSGPSQAAPRAVKSTRGVGAWPRACFGASLLVLMRLMPSTHLNIAVERTVSGYCVQWLTAMQLSASLCVSRLCRASSVMVPIIGNAGDSLDLLCQLLPNAPVWFSQRASMRQPASARIRCCGGHPTTQVSRSSSRSRAARAMAARALRGVLLR